VLAHACPCNKQSYYVVRTSENPVSYNGIIAQTLKGIGSIFLVEIVFLESFFFGSLFGNEFEWDSHLHTYTLTTDKSDSMWN